jgi:hypothetical protein
VELGAKSPSIYFSDERIFAERREGLQYYPFFFHSYKVKCFCAEVVFKKQENKDDPDARNSAG